MPSCTIRWCGKNTSNSSYLKNGISFHRFPNDPLKKKAWINATCRDNFFPTKHSVVCSRHFPSDCFEYIKNGRRLFTSAVPTLYLPKLTQQPNTTDTQNQPSLLESIQPMEISTSMDLPPTSKIEEIQYEDLTPRNRKMKRQIDHLMYSLAKKKKVVKRLQDKTRFLQKKSLQDKTRLLQKKVATLNEILSTLTTKSLINKENEDILKSIGVENSELVIRQQPNFVTEHIPKTKYSPELRSFALTLHFYSPKAYDFVRKSFSTCLPHPNTLRKWYQSVDGQPGFTKEAIDTLKVVSREGHGNEIFATIIFDEMAIKRGIEYHPQGKRMYGHVSYGTVLESDCQEEANEALVFLLVPVNESYKIPFGYFLINSVNSDQKASLLTHAIHLIEETGIRVVAVTFDACPANLAMAKKLGCTLDAHKLVTTFKNPCNKSRVAIFLDPAHMIELVRNAFECYGSFINKDDQKISWTHLVNLHNLQTEEHFHMANRLRAAHILSKSVSDAPTFCKDELKLPEFRDVTATATTDFLQLMNDLFDILDSHVHGHDFKRAIHEENAACVINKLDVAKNEILNMFALIDKTNENQKVELVKSPRCTGFMGLCVCIDSAKYLIQELVLNPECHIKYLSLHKTSQDHLEHFFGSIRCHSGSNKDPTARQFESSYKKLLTYSQIKNTGSRNCAALNQISVLHCTSAVDRINATTRYKDQVNNLDNPDPGIQIDYILTEFSEKVAESMPGYVVHSLTKQIKCQTCIGALIVEPNKASLQNQKDTRKKIMYGSTTVIEICRRCEIHIRRAISESGGRTINSKYNSDFFVIAVLKSFVGYNLFPDINFHQFDVETTNHIVDLTSCVIKKYVDARLSFVTKNSQNAKDYIRKIYKTY